MTTKQKLDWLPLAGMDAADRSREYPLVYVDDGSMGFHAQLPEGMTAQEALADYAAGYDAGDRAEVTVTYRVYEGGEEVTCDDCTFTCPAPR